MERTIDRTSYRRSARPNGRITEKVQELEVKKANKKFRLTNLLLNQIIVSLLIIIGILTAQYFEVSDVLDWISKNMSNGYEPTELVAKIKNKFFMGGSSILTSMNSGENFSGEISGEIISLHESGENLISGETVNSGELISAVEGVNQIAEDVNSINANYDLAIPLVGTITSNFGSRMSDSPIVSSYHTGLDIAANTGTNIYAAHSGTVTKAELFSSYGNCVMIEEGDLVTVYAHCSSLLVKEGQNVNKGDVIAKVGMTGNATGPHLHFEVRYEGRFVDPQKILTELN